MMLRFLIHFMYDIHQPVQVTNFWSDEFLSEDNRGQLFNLNSNYENLNSLWQSGLGQLDQELRRPLSNESHEQLDTWANWCTGNYSRSDLKEELKASNALAWSDMTFETAVNKVYAGISTGDQPSDDYLAAGWKAMMKQISLAGYRLSDTLSVLYEGKKLNLS